MDNTKYTNAAWRGVKGEVEETRTVEFIISSGNKDRHNTVLNPENWRIENFNKNGVVGYQHNVYGDSFCYEPNPDSVIGKGIARRDGGLLIGSVAFEPADINPLAEKIFRKVLFGSLRATSVGFIPFGEGSYGVGEERQGGKNETFYFAGQELLEFSIVNIPSNPDAVAREIRSQGAAALMALKRHFGSRFTFAEIEKMTIATAIAEMSGEYKRAESDIKQLARARALDTI